MKKKFIIISVLFLILYVVISSMVGRDTLSVIKNGFSTELKYKVKKYEKHLLLKSYQGNGFVEPIKYFVPSINNKNYIYSKFTKMRSCIYMIINHT